MALEDYVGGASCRATDGDGIITLNPAKGAVIGVLAGESGLDLETTLTEQTGREVVYASRVRAYPNTDPRGCEPPLAGATSA